MMSYQTQGPLVIGVDVGGTNTDSVLLDLSRPGTSAVVSANKSPTTPDVTDGINTTLTTLLSEPVSVKSDGCSTETKAPVDRASIAALTIGTTHFLNAIIQRNAKLLSRVAVIRLGSHGFVDNPSPFADWPPSLQSIIEGYSAVVPGGVNVDGKQVAPLDVSSFDKPAHDIYELGLRHIVIVGMGSPGDQDYHQEEEAKKYILAEMEKLDASYAGSLDFVLSHTVAGSGLLTRENASILNASILNFARRTIRSFISAMRKVGLRCPLYLTSNAGHLLPYSEAVNFPINVFSSGATNSMRGAAFLAHDVVRSGSENGSVIVVDVGGTTSDVGALLRNGYPRLNNAYTNLAGVMVNLQMPAVESIGLGGGSIVRVADETRGATSVGPDSVGHALVTEALCFGGETLTATDIAVSSLSQTDSPLSVGDASLVKVSSQIVTASQSRIKRMFESLIDRIKLSPDDCTVILVGGGGVICPSWLRGVSRIVRPEHAGVANAIGAALAKIHGAAEAIVDAADIEEGISKVNDSAIQNAVARGADGGSVTVLNETVQWVPYVDGKQLVQIDVACPADHARVYSEMLKVSEKGGILSEGAQEPGQDVQSAKQNATEGTRRPEAACGATKDEDLIDLSTYRPLILPSGEWLVSEIDLKFLEIGCYILGCGGGGSPHATYLSLVELLRQGERIAIVSPESLPDDAVLPPTASIGTPAVSLERISSDAVFHAIKRLGQELGGIEATHMLAVEIGGMNGLASLRWAATRYCNVPVVDGDLMGRAYPNFEMISQYVFADNINDLLPVAICSGDGRESIVPAGQKDETSAGLEIRKVCMEYGFAAGAAGNILSGAKFRRVGLPNTFSLAWRLGRVVRRAQVESTLSNVTDALIAEVGGSASARKLFTGKIRRVETKITETAHSLGQVVIERLGDDEAERDSTGNLEEDWSEIRVPFMNENLAVVVKTKNGEEKALATIPDLIFLLDVSTGEAIGVQEYSFGRVPLILHDSRQRVVGPMREARWSFWNVCVYVHSEEAGCEGEWQEHGSKNRLGLEWLGLSRPPIAHRDIEGRVGVSQSGLGTRSRRPMVWPPCGHGSLLLTSQRADLAMRVSASLSLQPFDDKQGSKLLMSYIHDGGNATQAPIAEQLSREVDGLPLLLVGLGGFMAHSYTTLPEALSILQNHRTSTHRDIFSNNVTQSAAFMYDRPVQLVFRMSLDRLPESARQIINIMSMLSPEEIPETLLYEDVATSAAGRDPVSNELVVQESNVFYSMHRSVQRSVMSALDEQQDKRLSVFDQAVNLISRKLPKYPPIMVPRLDKFHVYTVCIPHVMSIHKAGNTEPCLELAATGEQVCRELAVRAANSGMQETTSDVHRSSSLVRLEANIIAYGFGVLLERGGMGDRQQAHDEAHRIIELREKYITDTPRSELSDADYILLANAYGDWALQLANEGFYQESREYSERSLSMKERYLGGQENGFEFLTSKSLIATAHLAVGTGRLALALAKDSLVGVERENGPDHPYTRHQSFILANFHAAVGEYAEGLTIHRMALEARRSLFGEFNSDTLNSYYAVALCLFRLQRHEEARDAVASCLANKETAPWCPESILRATYLQSLIMQSIEGDKKWKQQEADAIRKRNELLLKFGCGAWASPTEMEDDFLYFDFINTNLNTMGSSLALPPLRDESVALERRSSIAGEFDQLIDHSNPSLGTFKQRFWWNDEYYAGPGSPMVLITPGEVDADDFTGYITNATIIGWMAKEINAGAILLEHRYWGTSNPVPSYSTENMKYLTVENALQDLVYFAKNVQLPFDPDHTSTPDKAPWVLSGGSYPGALVSWMASKYPGTFWAYHSSAGVVHALEDFWDYFTPVEKAMPRNCSADVHLVVEHMDNVLANGTPAEKMAFKTEFGLELLAHDDEVASALQWGLYTWQSHNFNTLRRTDFHEFCDYVENQWPGSNTPVPDANGVGLVRARAGYAKWVREVLLTRRCGRLTTTHNTIQKVAARCFGAHAPDSSDLNEALTSTSNRQWQWMLCNEPFKWWRGGAPKGEPSLIGRAMGVEYYDRQCGYMFDHAGKPGSYGIKDGLNVTEVNASLGGWEATVGLERIVYVNGEYDPWLGATVASPNFPGGPFQSTDRAPHYIIPQGMHCSDMQASNAAVNEGVHAVMTQVVADIARFVAEFEPKPTEVATPTEDTTVEPEEPTETSSCSS
ncbi:putative extracellular serine carboxypeptidase [Paramyrothecium foliicola]|nr:putative extracellular serine carboxypeptidase [Paramyrothecium foliicola]